MKTSGIITVGLCPCWDRTCITENLNWGDHKKISSQTLTPAGKAFNICKALAWLNTESTAAGLWGQDDYQAMLKAVDPLKEYIKIKFTPSPGQTRQNITILDTAKKKDMHLRAKSELASTDSLKHLLSDLKKIVNPDSLCVFAGAMPEGPLLDETLSIIETIKTAGSKIVIDTSGQALKSIVSAGQIYLIKPNVEELGELLNKRITDNTDNIVASAKTLLDKVEIILVSRGKAGAVVVTKEQVLRGRFFGDEIEINNTVSCGDFLLAGFLNALGENSLATALDAGIKVASARAASWTEQMKWNEAKNKIKTTIRNAG